MNIEWVIPARYVEVHDNLATIIGGGIDTFWLQELPGPFQVGLAVRLNGMAEELDGRDHQVKNLVRDPRGELISEMEGTFAISGEAARPEWLVGFCLATVVRFDVEEEGTFTVEHVVDDASYSVPLHIVHGLPPGVEEP